MEQNISTRFFGFAIRLLFYTQNNSITFFVCGEKISFCQKDWFWGNFRRIMQVSVFSFVRNNSFSFEEKKCFCTKRKNVYEYRGNIETVLQILSTETQKLQQFLLFFQFKFPPVFQSDRKLKNWAKTVLLLLIREFRAFDRHKGVDMFTPRWNCTLSSRYFEKKRVHFDINEV